MWSLSQESPCHALFLAAPGLPYRTQAFSSCGEQELPSSSGAQASVCGGFSRCRAQALGHTASVVVPHGFSSCVPRTWLLRSMWNLPGSGIEPVTSALAGGFFTTESSGKPCHAFLREEFFPLLCIWSSLREAESLRES